MRLSLKRLQPDAVFSSFLGLLDIKLGCEIILLFGLINKVAGVYGLITVFVGGSFLQLSFYAYSVATLFAFQWALRAVKSESSQQTLLVAHLYTLDHVLQSLAHYLFFLHYWYVAPHDGRRTANSQAQQDLIDLALSRGEIAAPSAGGVGDDVRAELAGEIWNHEKGYAIATLLFGWALKVYFICVIYSYAAHLRTSSYHALPTTARSKATRVAHPTTEADLAAERELGLPRGSSEGVRPGAHALDDAAGDMAGSASGLGAAASAASSSSAGHSGGSGGPREGRVKVEAVKDDDDFSWD